MTDWIGIGSRSRGLMYGSATMHDTSSGAGSPELGTALRVTGKFAREIRILGP